MGTRGSRAYTDHCLDNSELHMHGVTMNELMKIPMLLYAYTGKSEYLQAALKADEKMEQYSKRISKVEEESREIIRTAKIQADAQARDIIEDARKEAGDIIAKAEKTIEKEKEKAMEEMKHEIAVLAVMAAEKIVEREIQRAGQEAIVEEVIRQARSTGWRN